MLDATQNRELVFSDPAAVRANGFEYESFSNCMFTNLPLAGTRCSSMNMTGACSTDAHLETMTINGEKVSDLPAAYDKTKG